MEKTNIFGRNRGAVSHIFHQTRQTSALNVKNRVAHNSPNRYFYNYNLATNYDQNLKLKLKTGTKT